MSFRSLDRDGGQKVRCAKVGVAQRRLPNPINESTSCEFDRNSGVEIVQSAIRYQIKINDIQDRIARSIRNLNSIRLPIESDLTFPKPFSLRPPLPPPVSFIRCARLSAIFQFFERTTFFHIIFPAVTQINLKTNLSTRIPVLL